MFPNVATVNRPRVVNTSSRRKRPAVPVADALHAFIHSSAHRSPKTLETLTERLTPFVDCLARLGIHDVLDVTREHVEGFIREIAGGRRGKPLSAHSVYGYTKDVKAFINYVAENLAPEDWQNPVRKLKLRQP